MKNFEKDRLSNGISIITRQNKDTPRIALNMFIDAGINREEKAGIATLTGRLLLQGTKTRTAEDIANELENNGIEMNVSAAEDYAKISALFLNEDIEKTLEILEDIIKNSTFNNFEKEVKKLEGEIKASLDSPVKKAQDNLLSNVFDDSPYGNTSTKILENLNSITKEDITSFFKEHYTIEKVCVSVVGDIEKDKAVSLIEERLSDIPKCCCVVKELNITPLSSNKTVTIAKNDVAQAQVFQGWITPSACDKDSASLILLNIILGSGGLSSRLFLELRDKKGLAYTVRSNYSPYRYSGLFSIYIATEPKNIEISLDGFKEEINKLIANPVSEDELKEAKNNFIGKRAFAHETNSKQAHYLGYYEIIGLGADYDNKINNIISTITAKDLQYVAEKYLSKESVISILAPETFLTEY